MNYPKHVIDYAIDNHVSLEEAYDYFILHGEVEKKKEEEVVPDINIEEEKQFLSELEQKIKGVSGSPDDMEWWANWQKKMKKIEEMEKELGVERDDIITKEEYDWVEAELKEVDKLYDEMYGKDV